MWDSILLSTAITVAIFLRLFLPHMQRRARYVRKSKDVTADFWGYEQTKHMLRENRWAEALCISQHHQSWGIWVADSIAIPLSQAHKSADESLPFRVHVPQGICHMDSLVVERWNSIRKLTQI
jgi:hypothetical protein